MRRLFLPVLLFSLGAFAQSAVTLTQVVSGLANPVDIQFPKDRSGRMFVVEQPGRIRLVKSGMLQTAPYLDIASKITFGGERGLLSMALSPTFRTTGRFYVHYTDRSGHTVIARYTAQPNADTAPVASEQIILQAQQPASNHNGGTITFGPDGFLYIALGDGGGSNDQFQNGQNRQSLLGKILRIDTEGVTAGGAPYGIPESNPFVGDNRYRPEIWALGLRNPWRISFDRDTGDLWIADVGQNRAEEINFQPGTSGGGQNYGWNVMEGLRCRTGDTCDREGLTPPIYEYTREAGDLSITGGYVYRGVAGGLGTFYVFGDYETGRIWALFPGAGNSTRIELRGRGFNVSTFGEDANGELYVADHAGAIHRIEFRGNATVVNAASFAPGLAPGMITTVFAQNILGNDEVFLAGSIPLPRQLGGVEVRVNGAAVPLYAVTRNQVNFQSPYDAPGSAPVEIRRNGQTIATQLSSQPSSGRLPGVFSYGGFREAIVVRNADFTLAEELEPGGDYFLYATGLGPVTNQPALGEAPGAQLSSMTTLPRITINRFDCVVTFAGLAPGLVGVYQVNFRVPANVPKGVQRLVVTSGTSASNGNWVNIK